MQSKGKGRLFLWFMGLMGARCPIYLAAILVSSIGTGFRKVAIAWIVESIITAAGSRNVDGLMSKAALQFLAFCFGWWLWRVGIMRYNIEGKKGVAKLEKMIFSKAMRLPYTYYENHHSGDFMSKLIFDTERAGDIYGSRLRRLLSAIIEAVVYLIPMVYYSPQLTICLLLLSMLSFLVNSCFLEPMKAVGGKLAKENGKMMEQLSNMLAGMEVVKLFPVGQKLLDTFRESVKSCFAVQKKTNKMSGALESLNCMFDLLGALAFLGLGIWFVSENRITLGALTAIYTIYGSFRYVFLDIGKYLPQMMNCLANVENLYDFLQQEEEPKQYKIQGNLEKADREYALSVKHITFGYREDKKIFSDFTMKVKEGTCIAVVGESGRGKSTLAKLLLGFYPVEKGIIDVVGRNGKNSSLKEMREMIAYVPQEPYLYGVSIAENIAYGRSCTMPENVPMEDIIAAAKVANAHEFIMALPDGYQTIPGERGNTLSGGEKQRIAIARAVLKNAPVLLLDEATSALDNESEQLVNEALRRVCEGRTTIMIAHRQSTIALADEVITVT